MKRSDGRNAKIEFSRTLVLSLEREHFAREDRNTDLSGGPTSCSAHLVAPRSVVGMMSSGVTEWRVAQAQRASLAYSLNTNVSIAEPAHLIEEAVTEFRKAQPIKVEKLPTLAELRAKYPKPDADTELTWDSWVQARQ